MSAPFLTRGGQVGSEFGAATHKGRGTALKRGWFSQWPGNGQADQRPPVRLQEPGGLRGVMVSNDYPSAHGFEPERWPLKPGTIHPARLEKSLAELRFHPAELTEVEVRPFLPGLEGMGREDLDKAEKDPRMQSLLKTIADCTSIHSAATALIQSEPWDFMAVYFDAIDHFGHAFMRYHPPRQKHIDEWDFRVFNYCLKAGYRYHDMMLGKLLRLAGKDTTVILMSDHGFHPDHLHPSGIPREPTGPAVEHRQFGILVAKGPVSGKMSAFTGPTCSISAQRCCISSVCLLGRTWMARCCSTFMTAPRRASACGPALILRCTAPAPLQPGHP